jgi:hypothetical protein
VVPDGAAVTVATPVGLAVVVLRTFSIRASLRGGRAYEVTVEVTVAVLVAVFVVVIYVSSGP